MSHEAVLTAAGQRVLDAAAELFYAQGIHGVGVAGIAAHAGVTKKTLYACFGSKDGVVVAYLKQRDNDWRQILGAHLALAPASPLTVFDSYVDHLERGSVVKGCGFINAAADLATTHPAMTVIREHKAEVRRVLLDLLPAHDRAPGVREALATHLFYLLEGGVVHAGIAGSLRPLAASRELARNVLNSSPREAL